MNSNNKGHAYSDRETLLSIIREATTQNNHKPVPPITVKIPRNKIKADVSRKRKVNHADESEASPSNKRNAGSSNTRNSSSSNTRGAGSSNKREAGSSNTREAGSSNTREAGSSNTREAGSSNKREVGSSNKREAGSSNTRKAGSSNKREVGSSNTREAGSSNTREAIHSKKMILIKKEDDLSNKSEVVSSIKKEPGASVKRELIHSIKKDTSPSNKKEARLSNTKEASFSNEREAGPSNKRENCPSNTREASHSKKRDAGPSNNIEATLSMSTAVGPSTQTASASCTKSEGDPASNTASGPSIKKEPYTFSSYANIHTRNPSHDHLVDWRVENALMLNKKVLCHPLPKIEPCKTGINVLLKFKENRPEKFMEVSVGFQRRNKSDVSIHLSYDLCLKNSEGDVYIHKKSEMNCKKYQKQYYCMSTKFTKNSSSFNDFKRGSRQGSLLRGDLESKGLAILGKGQTVLYLLPDGMLFVKGHVKFIGCCATTITGVQIPYSGCLQDDSFEVCNFKTHVALHSDLRKALEQNIYTDFALSVNGRNYFTHKFVLSARSAVFRRLLLTDDKSNCIIPDISNFVFEEVLDFLYTGELQKAYDWDTLKGMYRAGYQYEIVSLKEECAQLILHDMSMNIACEALELAQSCNDDTLKSNITDFITSNFDLMRNTTKFLNLEEHLKLEVYERYTAISQCKSGI